MNAEESPSENNRLATSMGGAGSSFSEESDPFSNKSEKAYSNKKAKESFQAVTTGG